MNEFRRNFMKGSALLALGAIQAFSFDEVLKPLNVDKNPQIMKYFLYDTSCINNTDLTQFKADKVLVIDKDIAFIYSELKSAFKQKAIIGSIGSYESFFVLSRMGVDYGLRVVHKQERDGVLEWILAPKGVKLNQMQNV